VVPAEPVYLALLVDASLSMRGDDYKPNRITAARRAARVLVAGLLEAGVPLQASLTLFYKRPVTLLYPTTAVEDIMDAIDSITVLGEATAVGDALLEAAHLLYSSSPEGSRREVVVVTDGTFNEGIAPSLAAGTLRRLGARVHVLSFARLTRIDYEAIRRMTEITGGSWMHARSTEELIGNASRLAEELARPRRRV
jgi:Ca-activated chloride channel family protein